MIMSKKTNADSLTLKRSFAAVGGQEIVQFHYPWEQDEIGRISTTPQGLPRTHSIHNSTKRRSISAPWSQTMPSQTSPIAPAAFPSFMSVFGSRNLEVRNDLKEEEIIANNTSNDITDRLEKPTILTTTSLGGETYPISSVYHHRGTASISSESTDSSPTTTISTFDSPSITDTSPSSSPESPNSTLPISPFQAMMNSRPRSSQGGSSQDSIAPSSNISDSYRVELSGNNSRNVKNLSLPITGTPPARPATASGLESSNTLFTPLSPLKGPLRTGRRKPTNLSIQTPGIEKTSFLGTVSDVPPTPSQRPFLPYFQSSPALPSLLSPLNAPAGGMQLSTPSFSRIHSRPGSQSSFSNQSINGKGPHDLREEDDHYRPPKSQETQERGYPNGPIQVYDCGVYLYLEPNYEEAAKFDTVINVAKEIKNPFVESQPGGSDTVMSVWRNEEDSARISEPQTAVSEISFKSAFEWPQATQIVSPTTPKAQLPQLPKKEPEYIHVPWDHNSELIDDLLPLCRIIDSRIASGKKVLIHCQLGVSRSASLVLAYGLYKGYKPDFHAMYGAVKERSQWISPNMSLIYQLMDFRSKVERGHFSGATREPPAEWFKALDLKAPFDTASAPVTPTGVSKPPMKSRSTQTDNSFTTARPVPKLMKALPPVPLFTIEAARMPMASKNCALPDATSSADSTQTVFPASVASISPLIQSSNRGVSRPLPLREFPTSQMQSFEIPLQSSTSSSRPTLSISQPTAQMDLAMRDVPDTPSLFSPRQTEFVATPFARTIAGDLAVVNDQRPLHIGVEVASLRAVDPRSPHQRSETGEITRSIDEVL